MLATEAALSPASWLLQVGDATPINLRNPRATRQRHRHAHLGCNQFEDVRNASLTAAGQGKRPRTPKQRTVCAEREQAHDIKP